MKNPAFFDLDGTLVDTTLLHPLIWFQRHRAMPWEGLGSIAACLMQIPLYWTLEQIDRRQFHRLFFRRYAGLTHNRLVTLAEDMYRAVIAPRVYRAAREHIAAMHTAGETPILVTGALDCTVQPLARAFGIPHVIANALEMRAGRATGRLAQPSLVGETKVNAMRAFAGAHGFRLEDAAAYADSYSDLPMLSAVGRPHVVRGDWRLRRVAQQKRWPIETWTR